MLPGPGILVLIGFEGWQADGYRTGAARRAQAHIHFIERAFRRGRRQRSDEALSKACVPGLRFQRVGIIDDEDVEIGSGRQLLAAQLAHGEHAPGTVLGPVAPLGFPFRGGGHFPDRVVGQRSPVFRRILRRDQPVQQAVARQEMLVAVIAAPQIQRAVEARIRSDLRPNRAPAR
jgi:hypothetical protein